MSASCCSVPEIAESDTVEEGDDGDVYGHRQGSGAKEQLTVRALSANAEGAASDGRRAAERAE
jgi:hypothetical protein